jgi:putative DNA primase/helicase
MRRHPVVRTLFSDPKGHPSLANMCLNRSKKGHILATRHNVIVLLQQHADWKGVLGFDARMNECMFIAPPPFALEGTLPCPVTNAHATALGYHLAKLTHADFDTTKLNECINLVSQENSYDPVATYLNEQALPAWDGKPRLASFLHRYFGAEDTPYSALVGERWLKSAVARTLKPGCQADHMLILEGAQGIGKSTALLKLAGAWYGGDPPAIIQTIRFKEYLLGRWIVDISELQALRSNVAAAIKCELTTREDRFRLPYARRTEAFPRRVAFAGTTNEFQYLNDPTGNRRYWPVACSKIDLTGLGRDRDIIWGEAVAGVLDGDPWHLTTSDEIAMAEGEQRLRLEIDPWEQKVQGLSTSEIFAKMPLIPVSLFMENALTSLNHEQDDHRARTRIGRVMARLGFTRCQRRVEGKVCDFYQSPRR